MIKYLPHEAIVKSKWDECISRSFNGNVYAYSWYLDIVSGLQWDALIEGDYEVVMPLTWKRKFGISYLYQPYFTQQLGVFSTQKLSGEKVREFIHAIPNRFKLVEINLNKFNTLKSDGWELKENRTYELDLINSYENIRSNYSKNLQRNLKKAAKNKLEIIRNAKPEPIVEMFRANKGKEVANFSERQYKLLLRLIYQCVHNGKGLIWGAYDGKNELCAGIFFVESNNKVIFLFSALNDHGRELGAMPWLVDKFINYNSQKNITLDFEGSNDDNLARFYRGFGAVESNYLGLKINRLPFPLYLLK